jgi:hypothetical protein
VDKTANDWTPTISPLPNELGAPNITISPALPAGLNLNNNNGIISGIPTVFSAVGNYIVTASNNSGTYTTTITLSVQTDPPSFQYRTTSFTGTENQAFSESPLFTPAGASAASFTGFSVAPNLPAGLLLNTTSGAISGIPIEAPTRTDYTITATSNGNPPVSKTISLEILPVPITLSPANQSEVFFIGVSKQVQLPRSGGTPFPNSFTVSPNLPQGLNLNPSNGIISGIATQLSANRSYTISATNRSGTASATINIEVKDQIPNPSYPGTPFTFYESNTAITPVSPSLNGAGLPLPIDSDHFF